jgi:2-dehydropantoate 2-reductase
VPVVTSGAEAGAVDYLVVTTKARDTASALEALRGLQVETALSLQNGIAKDDLLAQAFGAGRVIGAATTVGAGLVAPGHARMTLTGATWLGELGGGSSERVARLAAVFRAAGFPAWSVADVRAVEWYKLCALLPGALVTALSRRPYDEMALHSDLALAFVRLMRETFAVPLARGVSIEDPPGSFWRFASWLALPDDAVLAALREMGKRVQAGGQKVLPSMLQDVLAGRRTEAAEVGAELLRYAGESGIPVPSTDTCYRLVRGLEDGFQAA